jgi:U3 small nucleolar RNA-associated protein 10
MTTCLAALAGSTDDETQWKYLNYQVLLNLRSSSPGVRMCVLGIVNAFVERKGENYLSVLPDAVPFLYETMEDEDPKLEAACKALVKGMEQVFGQSVSSYFE